MVMVREQCPSVQLPAIHLRRVEQGFLQNFEFFIAIEEAPFVKGGSRHHVECVRHKVVLRCVMPIAYLYLLHRLCLLNFGMQRLLPLVRSHLSLQPCKTLAEASLQHSKVFAKRKLLLLSAEAKLPLFAEASLQHSKFLLNLTLQHSKDLILSTS